MKKFLLFLTLKVLFFSTCFAIPTINIRGGHERYWYNFTEGWMEADHSGSGFHVITDRVRPNIWIRVFKYDEARSDVAGLPNNVTASEHVDWGSDLSDPGKQILADGDYNRLLDRADLARAISPVNTASGICSDSSKRCYGNWVNNDAIWGPSDIGGVDYNDKNGNSFFTLRPEMNGQKRTRYRFDVYCEDNTPFWFKDNASGAATYATTDTRHLYFPFESLVVRIIAKSEIASVSATVPNPKDEFYIKKEGKDFLIEDGQNPAAPAGKPIPEMVRKNGALVYHLPVLHSFQEATDYVIQAVVLDAQGNKRELRVPISMDPLGGLTIHNRSSGTQRAE